MSWLATHREIVLALVIVLMVAAIGAYAPALVEGTSLLGVLDDTALVARVNCYRRYLGVFEMGGGAAMQESATTHLAYMATHAVLDPDSTEYAQTRAALYALEDL